MSEPPAPPRFTVVRGEPTAAELIAVVVVLSARAGRRGPAVPAGRAISQWPGKSRQLRPQLTPGPGAWRASAQPR